MTWQLFILMALATFAISQTATRYDGIGNVFSKIRGHNGDWWQELWSCPVCLGWWVSLYITILVFLVADGVSGVGLFLLTWLGVSGASMILNLWSDQ